MNGRHITIGLCAAAVFQFVVLCAEYGNAALPLWLGKEVRIATIPVDPRSLFRGNYARLQYEISRIDPPKDYIDRDLRQNEPIYIQLKLAEDELYVYDRASLEKPKSGVFLRGRIQNKRRSNRHGPLYINYGIEAFFAEKEKALALEKTLRNGGVAQLMVLANGRAALKNVTAKRAATSSSN